MDNNLTEMTCTKAYKFIYDIIISQDFQQQSIMIMSVSIELYRVMVSSLLLLFIPQDCGKEMCTLTDNLNEPEHQYKIGFILNYITMGAFIIMYITEIRREENLIKLLEVNPTISTDNDSVGQRLMIFPEYKRTQLVNVVQQYQYASYFVIAIFIINTIFSWHVIYPRSLGNQTIINLITNILFMISKLSNVLTIIHTDGNIFFSAYLNTKVQFNDIDPREIIKINKRWSSTTISESQKEISESQKEILESQKEILESQKEVLESEIEIINDTIVVTN